MLAYIDPGSGSLIIQGLIAAVIAIPFFFRQQIARVVQRVRHDEPSPDQGMSPVDKAD